MAPLPPSQSIPAFSSGAESSAPHPDSGRTKALSGPPPQGQNRGSVEIPLLRGKRKDFYLSGQIDVSEQEKELFAYRM